MKRALYIFLVLVVMAGLLSVNAMADGDAAIRVSTADADAGDTVTLEVSLENNPGIMAFILNVEYDETRLEKVKFSHTGLQGLWAMSENAVWVGNGDSTYEGVFLKLKFRVLEDAPSGDAAVTVTYGEGDICNYDEENVYFAVVSGGVTVTGEAVESTPEATKTPETTDAPAATKTPVVTKAPEATNAPDNAAPAEVTKAPEKTEPVPNTEAPDDAAAPEEDAVPADETEGISMDEPVQPAGEEAAVAEPDTDSETVTAEASHTAPVLKSETADEADSGRSGILMLIIALAAVAVVLVVVILVILVKKSSYHGRH